MNRRFITLEQLKSVASALLAKINQKPDSNSLSDVSFTGDYNDLSNRPDFSNFVNQTTFNNAVSDINSNFMMIGRDYVTAGKKGGTTLGIKATAEGVETTASGNYSHAEGNNTTAQRRSQHVFGEYNVLDATGSNISDRGSYVEIVGNGDGNARSNARTLDWLGNEVLAGKLTVGADPTNNMDVATKQYVDSKEVPPEVFYINVTGSGTQAAPYTADHTYAEITTALSAGKLPIVIHNGGYYIYGGNSGDYDFYQAGATYIRSFFVTSANVWSDQIDSIVTSVNGVIGDVETSDILPDQTGKDGKFLMTDGSDVSWEAVEPEVFTVTLTLDLDYAPPRYIGDKTYSEIQAAITAGKIVQVQNGSWTYYYAGKDTIDNTLLLFVSSLYVTPDSNVKAPALDLFTLSSSNLWTSTGAIGQARITASGILKGDGSGRVTAAVAGTDYVASPEVFWATYGSTTFAQIKAAVNAGATIVGIKYLGTVAIMNSYVTSTSTAGFIAYGTTPSPANVVVIEMSVTNSTWSMTNHVLSQSGHTHAASDIASGTLGVARGGTGAASFTANSVIMSGSSTTAALTTRGVTNNTSNTALTNNNNIPTNNTVYYGLNHRINRSTAVNAADTGYTTYMARGEALNSSDTNPTVNGAISWTYA